jgi:hypothetical protein
MKVVIMKNTLNLLLKAINLKEKNALIIPNYRNTNVLIVKEM